jgi:hypothetical protein
MYVSFRTERIGCLALHSVLEKEDPPGNVNEKIVMTLLLPRKTRKTMKQTRYPYAVQMAIPKELTPGKRTPLVSVRLIHENGSRATAMETMDSYEPKKWRAASSLEQSQYTLEFSTNPLPWYSFIYSLSKDVYRYQGSGDLAVNNGQQWSGIENLAEEWKAEQETRNKCEEVLAAEWDRRIAKWGEND